MSYVCPWCNPGSASAKTKFRKPSRCSCQVQSGRKGGGKIRCDGLVCGTCGQCNRSGDHR
jgi:hypothetical protein